MPDKIITINNLKKFKEAYDAQSDEKLLAKADLVDGKVPVSQLPQSFDDVREYDSLSNMPQEGEAGVLYIAKDTNKQYRYDVTNGYVELSTQNCIEVVEYQTTTPLTDEQVEKAKVGKLAVLYDDGGGEYRELLLPARLYIASNTIYFASTKYYQGVSGGNFVDSFSSTYRSTTLNCTTKMLSMSTEHPMRLLDASSPRNVITNTDTPDSSGKQVIRALNLRKTQDMLADVYDDTATYNVGDMVIYQNQLYKCVTQIATAEAWDATHWTLVDVDGVLQTKQDTLVSGSSIKTLNSESLLGSGDIVLTKSSIGLGNVDNTSDLNKPISTATQTALDAKQATLVSGTNIKTVNGQSVLGSGNLSIDFDSMTPITYSELKALRDNAQLIPGMQYRITDYQFTTTSLTTHSANHAFDIIVVADTESMLNKNARACLHANDAYFANNNLSEWRLLYNLDNDATRFEWADTTNGKGVIYRMIDEFGNDVPYDFKNLVYEIRPSITIGPWGGSSYYTYARNSSLDENGYYGWTAIQTVSYGAQTNYWTATSSPSTGNTIYKDTAGTVLSSVSITKISTDDYDSYTFQHKKSGPTTTYVDASLTGFERDGNNCRDNIILPYTNVSKQKINNIRFTSNEYYLHCSNNTFAHDCYNNIFAHYCHDNIFGSRFHDNTFTSSCSCNRIREASSSNVVNGNFEYNDIGYNFTSNTIKYIFQYNTIGNNFHDNTITATGNNASLRNIFGNNFYNNVIDVSVNSCVFGNDCYNNHFYGTLTSNTIANSFYRNTVDSAFYDNVIANEFHDNVVGQSFTNNVIGNNCVSNKFGRTIRYNTIGNDFYNNTLGNRYDDMYIYYCKFDDGIQYTSLTCDTAGSVSSFIQYVHIHSGVKGTGGQSVTFLTITVPLRNNAYSIDYYATGSQEVYL